MIIARAPGKILLLGGYAVLDRPNIGWVVAVKKYVQATLEARKDPGVVLEIPDFGLKLEGDGMRFGGTREQLEKAKFVIQTIRMIFRYLKAKGMERRGFHLITRSDPAFALNKGKSGLGSSAAVTVATAAVVLEHHGIGHLDIIHKMAQAAHAQAQEKIGSGFDIAAACFGSIEYLRYSPEIIQLDKLEEDGALVRLIESSWDYFVGPAPLPEDLHLAVANIPDQSASTTQMVRRLFEWRKRDPDRYSQLTGMINQADRKALEGLRENDRVWFALNFSMSRQLTKELGELAGVDIEPDNLTAILNESLAHGAMVCKLPGAGGGDSVIALTGSEADRKKLEKFWKSKGLQPTGLRPVEDGLQWVKR